MNGQHILDGASFFSCSCSFFNFIFHNFNQSVICNFCQLWENMLIFVTIYIYILCISCGFHYPLLTWIPSSRTMLRYWKVMLTISLTRSCKAERGPKNKQNHRRRSSNWKLSLLYCGKTQNNRGCTLYAAASARRAGGGVPKRHTGTSPAKQTHPASVELCLQ